MDQNKFIQYTRKLTDGFTASRLTLILLGTAILSFGIYNIHRPSQVTEGGVLGMILFLNHWFNIPSSVIAPILDLTCYIFAFKYLGSSFIKFSIFSSFSLSAFFRLWEQFPPILPDLSSTPLLASIFGGLFVGMGVGLIVRQGGSSGGDDALALIISKLMNWKLSRAYLITDLTVLILSLSYIPFKKIAFSLVTVTISSFLIDIIQNFRFSSAVKEN